MPCLTVAAWLAKFAAPGVTASGATLNGTVTANNATTQWWFAYGTSSDSLTSTTPKTGALTGTTATPVSANLSGLKSNATYYFKALGSNGVGPANGGVLSFKTH